MLAIWTKQDRQAAERFCRMHASVSGEILDPDKLVLFLSGECPYAGYQVARLEIEPQVVPRTGTPQTLSARHLSYALISEDDHADFTIIPIWRQAPHSHNIYEINHLLGFTISERNVRRYLTFFGHVIWNPPFYFVDNLAQLATLIASTTNERKESVVRAIRSVFAADGQGLLSIDIKTKSYPFIGASYTFEMPALFKGQLYMTTVRVSHDGMCRMLRDRTLQVDGVFDDEENLIYYPLDVQPGLAKQLTALSERAVRIQRNVLRALTVDTVLQLWLLPLFIFHAFVIATSGRTSSVVFQYMQELRGSIILSGGSIILGSLGTAIAVLRYVFLELLMLLKNLVPSVWSFAAESISEQMKSALREHLFGTLVVAGLEYSCKSWMSLSLLLYGFASVAGRLVGTLNFGQAMVTVGANIPWFGRLVGWFFGGTDFAPVELPSPYSNELAATVGFVFTTIVVGLLTRLLFFRWEDRESDAV